MAPLFRLASQKEEARAAARHRPPCHMQFTQAISQFGQKIGLGDLRLDEQNSCSLLFDESIEVLFTADDEDKSVLFSCDLGKASELAADLEQARALLKAALLGAQTGGAAFAINSADDSLVLWKRHDDSFIDELDLEKKVNAFLEECIAWKEKVSRSEDDAGYLQGNDSLAGLGGALMI